MVQQDQVDQFELTGRRGVIRQQRHGGPRIRPREHPDPVRMALGHLEPRRIAQRREQHDDLVARLEFVEIRRRHADSFLAHDGDAQAHGLQLVCHHAGALFQVDGRRCRHKPEHARLCRANDLLPRLPHADHDHARQALENLRIGPHQLHEALSRH